MHEIVKVPLADLMVDTRNSRLREEQPSQPDAILALAQQQGSRIVNLASDIVEHSSLDPTALLAIVATDDQHKRYIALEGNRRLVALKALETPSLVLPALEPKDQQRLSSLAAKFAQDPISEITCVLFDTEAAAYHWIDLRHTGQNEGKGLVEWGADEKDRWQARHGTRSPAGQTLDFVEKNADLSPEARNSNKRILTNIKRLISTPFVREKLGIEIINDELHAQYPAQEVVKGLTRMVEDLLTGDTKVKDIYYEDDRKDYLRAFPPSSLPDPSTKLHAPVPISQLDSVNQQHKAPPKKKRRKKRPSHQSRTTVIPKDCVLDVAPPRINHIYIELLSLSSEDYANACSVLLRVFVELSVDHYIQQRSLLTENEMKSTQLSKRLRLVAIDLRKQGRIGEQLEKAIRRVADGGHLLAASVITMNQYVHNQFVVPKGSEIRAGWDELQPLLEQLWPAL